MNIFVLSMNTKQCAKWHCDKHITKMSLESTQLLCTAVNISGGSSPYKTAHRNHPCAIWARATRSNFLWLAELGYELCEEYARRYGRAHKCIEIIDTCVLAANVVPEGPLTTFAQAMPDEYKNNDVTEAYKAYYIGAKADIATWSHSQKPDWWPFSENAKADTVTQED